MSLQKLLAILSPFLALGLQWMLWPWIAPFVWFLFFPTVFFSARLGGFRIGLISTVLCAAIVWYFFLPPQLSWTIANINNTYSVGIFLVMGYLFSDTQERLNRAKQKVELALAETRSNNVKITELYQKTLELDELKNQFFANISHELRTPLTLIMSPVARRLANAELSAAERLESEMILRNAQLLYRHVTDLLDVAKIEAGEMCLQCTRINLAALVRVMASHFDSLATERRITFGLSIPELLFAEVDGEKIQRILLNLLSNAFKFTPDGGHIRLTLTAAGEQALIEVSDNGPGIPVALRTAIFERFRQAEGGAQRRFSGTGLGLAIVKNFVELHGGSVLADETPSGGALFSVRLPLKAPADAILATPTTLDDILGRQLVDELKSTKQTDVPEASPFHNIDDFWVLVVEDNSDMRQFVADVLRSQFKVMTAVDGREGLNKALGFKPDLIVTDLMMPEMSGDEMIRQLRLQPDFHDIPVIVLTARHDESERIRLLQLGIQAYLSKPFSVEELQIQANSLIARRRASLAELEQSEKALKEAQRMAGIGSWSWQIKSNQHTWSEQIYLLYGRDPSLPPANYPEVKQYFTANSWEQLSPVVENCLRNAAPYVCDLEVQHPDGGRLWVTVRGEAKCDTKGQVIELSGTVQDISDRKRYEDSLKKSRLQLQAFILHAPISIAMFDRSMNYLSTSRRWLLEFGAGAGYDDLTGLNHYQIIPDMPKFWRDIHNRGLMGETLKNDEELWIHADGRQQWLRWAVVPWADVGGEQGGIIISTEDITDRKLAEEQVRLLNADLERRVSERTAELSAANRELDSFAYAVSHDLRAPLRAMNGFSQALLEDYNQAIPQDAQLYLQQIGLAAQKMSELIDGLLVLSRATRGELKYDVVNLSSLCERILTEFKQTETERQISSQIEPGLLVRGDSRMLEVLMYNLLSNAWKYTSKIDEAHIRVYQETDQDVSRICVADNGAGFDMAYANRLFQPFQRLHRQEEFPGIGIGLATVERIIHRHGGLIEAQADIGKGAIFSFTLPKAT